MKNLFVIIALLVFGNIASAQILEPVKWSFTTEKVSDTEYNLIYKASIDDEWNVYSQFTSDDGPVPTSINYENKDGIKLSGNAVEKGHKKEGFDKLFEIALKRFHSPLLGFHNGDHQHN